MNMHKGRFITFEGIEGAGKSTQIATLADWLTSKGIDVVLTREPGGTVVGEAIRTVLLDKELPAMHESTELLLMFAARAEHLEKVIKPALNKGSWVLCDRFTDASFAYQGGGRGMDVDRIDILKLWVQQSMQPDITLLFDLSPEIGLERSEKRGPKDRFENEALSFFARVRQAYLQLANVDAARYIILDAEKNLEEVSQQMFHCLEQHSRWGL